MGLNPNHGDVFFLSAIFFFIFFAMVLFSQWCVQCSPAFGATLLWDQHPALGKEAIEINLSQQEEIFMKNSYQRHLWKEHGLKVLVLGLVRPGPVTGGAALARVELEDGALAVAAEDQAEPERKRTGA